MRVPDAPTILAPPEGQVWWLNTPGAFGTAEPDIEVWGYCDGDAPTLASRVPDDPGWGWSNPAPLADGPHTFTAFARNEHGDSPSVTVNFSVDTIAPVAPVITNYPTELVFGEGFTFSGTGEPGSWVTAWGINDGYDVEVAGDGAHAQVFDVVGQGLQPHLVDVEGADGEAAPGERQCGGTADPRGGAGDEDCSAVGHRPSSPIAKPPA